MKPLNNINSLYLTVNKFNAIYEKKIEKICASYNINYSSFVILNTIKMLQNPTPTSIAKINNTTRQNSSKIVIKLIAAKLIVEIKNSGKNKYLQLSYKGEELLKCLQIKFDDWNYYYCNKIENENVIDLKQKLNNIINILQNDE